MSKPSRFASKSRSKSRPLLSRFASDPLPAALNTISHTNINTHSARPGVVWGRSGTTLVLPYPHGPIPKAHFQSGRLIQVRLQHSSPQLGNGGSHLPVWPRTEGPVSHPMASLATARPALPLCSRAMHVPSRPSTRMNLGVGEPLGTESPGLILACATLCPPQSRIGPSGILGKSFWPRTITRPEASLPFLSVRFSIVSGGGLAARPYCRLGAGCPRPRVARWTRVDPLS